jgi:hypothetical protein
MKFLVPNYSCLQNPWLEGHCPRSPFSLSSTEFVEPPPRIIVLGTPLLGSSLICSNYTHAHISEKRLLKSLLPPVCVWKISNVQNEGTGYQRMRYWTILPSYCFNLFCSNLMDPLYKDVCIHALSSCAHPIMLGFSVVSKNLGKTQTVWTTTLARTRKCHNTYNMLIFPSRFRPFRKVANSDY